MEISRNRKLISVALLIKDLEAVKAICHALKDFGIVPHLYEDLEVFAEGVEERAPHLAIVDVLMLSNGQKHLNEIPCIADKSLPFLLYYTDKSEPLLKATHGLPFLSVLKKDDKLAEVLKFVFRFVNDTVDRKNEVYQLKKELKKKNEEIQNLEIARKNALRAEEFQFAARDLCLKFEEKRNREDFLTAFENVMDSCQEVDEFSVMELNYNKEKIISPLGHSRKYRTVPAVHLGKSAENGIDLLAQNLSIQVVGDVLAGGYLVNLLLKNSHGLIDKLIFVKTKNEMFFNLFDWNLFEAYLNGFYQSFGKTTNNAMEKTQARNQIFELMSQIDKGSFGSGDVNHGLKNVALIGLNFQEINKMILKNGAERFFWKKFKDDFILKFEMHAKIKFTTVEFGLMGLVFVIDQNHSEIFFDLMKNYITKFPFYNYFGNSDIALFKELKPIMKMIPSSSHGVLSFFMGEKVKDLQANMKKEELDIDRVWSSVRAYEI